MCRCGWQLCAQRGRFQNIACKRLSFNVLTTCIAGPKSETALTGSPQPAADTAAAFRFLSVFKWEARKGCDVLVRPASVSAPASLYCTQRVPQRLQVGGTQGLRRAGATRLCVCTRLCVYCTQRVPQRLQVGGTQGLRRAGATRLCVCTRLCVYCTQRVPQRLQVGGTQGLRRAGATRLCVCTCLRIQRCKSLRIVTLGGFWEIAKKHGCFVTLADFPLHECSPCPHVRLESLGFVHRSRTIFYRPVPNLGDVTVRNFRIAVR
jgi:hypothetical protein